MPDEFDEEDQVDFESTSYEPKDSDEVDEEEELEDDW